MQVSVAAGRARERQDELVVWLKANLAQRWDLFAFGALLAVAFALRFWDLGGRALHHDESLHAQFSWYLQQGRGYHHDPLMHGPFQFHINALSFVLFGASDYTARVPAAFFGTAMVALPFFLRGYLGRVGALLAAAFIAFSPTLLYFSRFTREDIYTAFWTLGIVVFMWRYLAEKRNLYLYLTAAFMALSFATKETTYLTVPIFVTYLEVLLAADFMRQIRRRHELTPERSVALFVVLLATGWLLAILWPLTSGVRRRWGVQEFPAVANLVIVMVTLAAPQYAGGIQLLGDRLPGLQGNDGYRAATEVDLRNITVSVLLILSVYVGIMWNPAIWLIAAAAFYVPYVLLFTTFFTNTAGFWSGIWGSTDYWIEQQSVRRGEQPAFYYFMLLPVYEFLPVLFALIGAAWLAFRNGAFSGFLIFWAGASLLAFTLAAEKMPWLSVHMALPIALLAAKSIDTLFDRLHKPVSLNLRLPFSERIADTRALLIVGPLLAALAVTVVIVSSASVGGVVFGLLLGLAALATVAWAGALAGGRALAQTGAAVVAAGLFVFSVRTAGVVSFEHGDIPVEPLVYVQSSPEIPRLLDDIERVAAATGQGRDIPIYYDDTDGRAWPWAWYLRDYRDVRFGSPENARQGDIILVAAEKKGELQVDLSQYGPEQPYPHNWWFPENYKSELTGSTFPKVLFNPSTWNVWRNFYVNRESYVQPDSLGRRASVAYFPTTYQTVLGERAAEEVSEPATPVVVDGQLIIGGPGAGQGRFAAPAGLSLDAQHNLYVADSQNHRIQKFDAEGRFLGAWGVSGGEQGQFNEPWGVAVDADGNVYVTDTWNHRIQKFDADFQFVRAWGEPFLEVGAREPEPLELFGPRDIAIDGEGDVWVTDTGNKRVLKFSPDGDALGAFGREGSSPGEFREPVGIDVGPAGEIYVADAWNRRIQRFDGDFNYLGEIAVPTWGSEEVTAKPYLTVMGNGNVIASDPANGNVLVYSGEGELLATWPLPSGAGGLGGRPLGIIADSQTEVYVSDGAANEVRRLPLSTIMGS